MMREEFNDLVYQIGYDNDSDLEFIKYPDEDEYSIIEKVYIYHPLFDKGNAKKKAAWLYVTFGMPIFRILLPKADELEILENKLQSARFKWHQSLSSDEVPNMDYYRALKKAEKNLNQAQAEVC